MGKIDFDVFHARFTFRNIPIHKLERFSFKDITAASQEFKKIPDVSECVIIQTASRVEIFLVINHQLGDSPDARRPEGASLALNKIEETWESLADLDDYDLDHFDQTLEVYKNFDAYQNLLRLACGLESLVVGKGEILEELKSAIARAKETKMSGRVLNKLFENIIRIATRIRESTGIGNNVITIGDQAVKIAEENAGIDEKKRVVLVGTGETAAFVAKALNKKGYGFEVASRTVERATGFSKILGGAPIEFTQVLSEFDKLDIVFVATTSDYFLISHDKLKRLMQNNKSGTMVLDVSDPRAVDEKVAMLPGVKLMFRDQIAENVEENMKARLNKVPEVEKMISKEVPIIEATMKRLDAEPIVVDVVSSIDSIRKKELEKALKELGETDENKIKIIEELTKAVAQNIVSVPPNSKNPSDQEN